jgi:flagellar M-ring protein FliF
MNFFDKIRAVWQKTSLVQRALLIAVVLTFVIVGVLLIYWVRRPDMRILYRELSPEEASKITEKISEQGIAYELRAGGTSIYVPEAKVYQLRLDMAKEGLPEGGQKGYRIFDNERIGISPTVQNINLKRALEEELAMSIQMINGVVHARVHLVSAERTLFSSQAGETTASVILRLKAGYRVSSLNIAAITNLVAGGVEGLRPEDVTVIDSEGHLLSYKSDQTMASGAGTVADYKERVEQNLANKVEDMLTVVLGPGRATVSVSAVIDMNSISTVTEKFEPKGVATKEEITTGSEIGASSVPVAGEPAVPGSTKKDETIITEYDVGKTVTQEVILPGKIKSLTVAAFVDLSPADVNEAGTGVQAATIMALSDVEEIIKNALGLRETDLLKVVDTKFHRPAELLIEEEPSNWPRYIAIARQVSLGVMAICALLVLRIFSGARKKMASTATAGELAGAGEAAGLLPAGAEGPEPLAVRKQITSALQSNPEQVKQLFSNWLEEKGE